MQKILIDALIQSTGTGPKALALIRSMKGVTKEEGNSFAEMFVPSIEPSNRKRKSTWKTRESKRIRK